MHLSLAHIPSPSGAPMRRRGSVRWLALLVSFALVLGAMVQPVQAALIGAQEVARHGGQLPQQDEAQRAAQIDRISVALARSDVQAELERHGVTVDQAMDRVHALSDTEVAQLSERVDDMPAGGIIGVILAVFLILLLTDILGLTKVFPFTR